MGRRLLQLISAAGLISGLVAVVVLVATAVVNPDVGQRVAAATAAATIVLALVGGLTTWQNSRLVAAATEQARLTREQAESSERLVRAAVEEAESAREQASASRDLVSAAIDQATASRAQAEASQHLAQAAAMQARAAVELVEETRVDRQLGFQPFVTAEVRQRGDHGGRQYVQVVVANIGRGPALHAAVAYHEFPDEAAGHLFGASPFFDMGPGESDSFTLYLDAGAAAQAFRRLVDDLPDPAVAVAFEDVVGNRYRWASGGGFRRQPDVWRRSDQVQPDWARWR